MLDIVLMKTKAHVSKIETLVEFNFDHDPVHLILDLNPTKTFLQTRPSTAVNWMAFRNQLTTSLPDNITTSNIHEVDETIIAISTTIAQEKAKATAVITPDKYTASTCPELLNLIKLKKQTRKRYQRQRLRDDKTELNCLTKKIHTLIQDHRIQQFDQDAKNDTQSDKIWKLTKRLTYTDKATAIIVKKGVMFSPQEKAEAIADCLKDQFQPNTPKQDNTTSSCH